MLYRVPRHLCTVYPKKYAHGFCFDVLCCGYTLTDFPISIRLTSLALWQSNDCPSASKATLMNMDKYFMWIHYERLHNQNKAKHNKTMCIFLGIYCNSLVHGASNMVIICYGNCLLPDPCQVPPLILTYFIVNWNKQRKCHLQNDNFVKTYMYWIPIVELDHILSCNKSWATFWVLLINFNSKGDCLLLKWFYSKLFHPIHNWYFASIQLELIYQRACSVKTLAQLHRQHRW